MINSIELKNFQAHQNTTFNFVPTLNIITGPTDSGKTGALRGLNWITSGKPDGFDFHSHWCGHGDKTEVKVEFDNGFVHRAKSKSKNVWDCNGMVLKATGKGVPVEVEKLINWSDINYCGQHDGAFLLTESDGKVAKKLNELVNLDIIDTTIGNLTSRIKATNKKIEVRKEAQDSIDEQLERFNGLEDAIKATSKLDLIESKYIRIDDDRVALKACYELVEQLESRLDGVDLDKAISAIDELIHLSLRKKELGGHVSELTRDLDAVTKAHHSLSDYVGLDEAIVLVGDLLVIKEKEDGLVGDLKSIETSLQDIHNLNVKLNTCEGVEEALAEVERLSKLGDFIDEQEKVSEILTRDLQEVRVLSASHKSLNIEVEELEKQFKDGMGNCCPLCESQLKEG